MYNLPFALHIEGTLNVPALEHALNAVVARHEALRTTIGAVDGLPVQIIAPVLTLTLPADDLQDGPASEREARAQALLQAEIARPFDLQKGPLLRARLLRLEPQTHILLLMAHHIVIDGWSINILLHELFTFYTSAIEAGPVELPALPVQYADFAIWQREWLQGATLEAHLAYWRQQLAGAPGFLTLPSDAPRPAILTSNGAQRSRMLPPELAESLTELGRNEGATLFMVLFAAFNVLVHHYTHQTDLVIGSPIANRTRGEIEPLIGFFVNMLALRSDLNGNPTFRDLLQRVRQTALGAYQHQELPFDKLVEALRLERDPSYAPLFQLMFALQSAPDMPEKRGDLRLSFWPSESQAAQFDVSLFVETSDADGFCCFVEYNTALFKAETIDRLLENYHRVLRQIVTGPGRRLADFSLLDEKERERMLVDWNRTQRDYPSGCLHALFEAQTARTPDATAAVWGEQQLTYRNLDRRANQLARHLQTLGAGPETLVALYMERGLDMLVSILGVLKAGAAYVPLDPHYPHARVGFILADTRAPLILTQRSLAGRLPESRAQLVCVDAPEAGLAHYPDAAPSCAADDRNLAYIIYTSGSTGTPKGVAIAHHSAVMLAHWALEVFEPAAFAGTLAATSVCFDLSIFEFFAPLSCGGAVILAENALQLPAAPPITLINTVPSAIAELVRLGTLPASVRVVNSAGEPLKTTLVQQLYALPHIEKVYDLYGPSEDTTYSTYALRRPDGPETIGRPIANTRVYLLDAQLNPAPLGVSGEIYLGGEGLARGYLGRPGLTAERFNPDPFSAAPGARLYRTGDLASYLPDGNLQFLGRMDHQVKVRGFRIELGEIEEQLLRHPAVEAAVVMVLESGRAGDRQLAAFVIANPEQALSSQDLRDCVQLSLPRYMVPAVFVILDAFPMTPNGKIDRRALMKLAPSESAPDAACAAARTPLEEQLCALWQQALGVERVGIHDNFFESGGHSLLAIQLLNRLSALLERSVPLSVIFEAPTVAALAERIATGNLENQAYTATAPSTQPPNKISRRALAQSALAEGASRSTFVAARTPLEQQLCECWQQLLELDAIGIHDNFFELGGHSLLAIQLLNRLSVLLKCQIPLSVIFEAPTVAALAEKIVVGAFEGESRAALTPIPHTGPLPLSFAQEQLWLIEQLSPGNRAYYLPIFVRLAGPLDAQTWEQALNLVVERHAVLRTTFDYGDGNPVQIVAPSLKIAVPVVDMPGADFAAIAQQANAQTRQPFSLATGPLLRGALYRISPSEHYLLLVVHHIVIDGWSLRILFGELVQAYAALLAGKPPALPELPLQYADFSVWQREWQRFGLLNRQLDYWTRQLAGAPPITDLPLDHPRSSAQTDEGAIESFVFPGDMTAAIKALSRREGVSPFALLLTAFQTLLYRYTQQSDLVVGVPVANRQHPEIENLIGYFVNTLAIRVRLEPTGAFLDALAQTRATVTEALSCQEVPFQHIVEALGVKPQPGYNPLFQLMFNFLQIEETLPQLPNLTLEWRNLDAGTSQFDLSLVIEEEKDRLCGIIEYNRNLFEQNTVLRFQTHYTALLKAILDDPRRALAALWDAARIPLPQVAPPVPEAAAPERPSEAQLRQRRDDLASRRAGLSDEKRALLEKRLRGE